MPNRNCLKIINSVSIDSQFLRQFGEKVFNFFGEPTEEYLKNCESLLEVLEDFELSITTLKNNLE